MRKTTIVVALSLFSYLSQSQVLSRKQIEITDYFMKLPVCGFDGANDADITKSRNLLLVTSPTNVCVVNNAVSLLSIINTKGRKFELILKQFKKSDNNYVIFLYERYQTNVCDSTSVRTFDYESKSGLLVETKGKVPAINFQMFCSEPLKPIAGLDIEASVSYQFTPSGSDTQVQVVPMEVSNESCISLKLTSGKDIEKQKKDLISAYRNALSSRSKKNLNLNWNASKAVFEIEDK